PLDRAHPPLGRFVFQHVPPHPQPDQRVQVLLVIVDGQGAHPGGRPFVRKGAGHRQAAPGHVDVEEEDVRLVAMDQLQSALGVIGLTHHLDVRLHGEQGGDRLADQGVIVGDANTDQLPLPLPVGIWTRIRVPWPGRLSTWKVPCNHSTRSRMCMRPYRPPDRQLFSRSKPTPLSATRRLTRLELNSRRTMICWARAWRKAFWTASWATRKRAASCSGWRRGRSSLWWKSIWG